MTKNETIVEEELTIAEFIEKFTNETNLEKPNVIPINNIEILSYDEKNNKETWSKIESVIIKEPVDEYFEIYGKNGENLKAASGHMVLNNSKWTQVDNLENAVKKNEKINVVDFEVKDTHNYIANGQINHNSVPGGYAPKFHSSVRIQLYKSGEIKDDKGNVIGVGVKAKTKKNRVSAGGRECTFSVYFSNGIDDLESNFNKLVDLEIIRRPTTQSYELDYNGQIYKFRTSQWRENVQKIEGLEEFLRKQVMEKNVLNFDTIKPQIDEETGNAKIENTNEVE